MYWPISVPRIIAHNTPHSTLHFAEEDEAEAHSIRPPAAIHDADDVSDSEDYDGLGPDGTGNGAVGGSKKHSEMVRDSNGDSSSPAKHPHPSSDTGIVDVQTSRAGFIFATISKRDLTIWQTRPLAVLAHVHRSQYSLETYGPNQVLLIRPDAQIFVIQTTLGFLITYSLAMDPISRVYKPTFLNSHGRSNNPAVNSYTGRHNAGGILPGPGEGEGVREVSIRFRMIIKVDAGIARGMALDDELLVVTESPAAVQCIRWTPDAKGTQTTTELLSRMGWLEKRVMVRDMVHDRAMNMSAWVTNDGRAYIVHRVNPLTEVEQGGQGRLFKGHCFHTPASSEEGATKVVINARFSLLAVACENGVIFVYKAKDHIGNAGLSHTVHPPARGAGKVTFVSWSPDGYALFVGYEKGWGMWSVFGKPGANSFNADRRPASEIQEDNFDGYLDGVRHGIWLAGGQEMLLTRNSDTDSRMWVLEMARSTVTGVFSSANISRAVLQTSDSLLLYRGYEQTDLTTVSNENTVAWTPVQLPTTYLIDNWPIKCTSISADGRYVAIAGRRGLAHYSVYSGRWKTFQDKDKEMGFCVRGGMGWYKHILIAAVEADGQYEIRLYSRELHLDDSLILHLEVMEAPVVLITLTGDASLLVYTADNVLHHFIFTTSVTNPSHETIMLAKVGQLQFTELIGSPSRVRGLSWILPREQLLTGDPTKDVVLATLLFLIDGTLLALQPSFDDAGQVQYEMRRLLTNVEYYILMRDRPSITSSPASFSEIPETPAIDQLLDAPLSDSLWVFDGKSMRVYPSVSLLTSPGMSPLPSPNASTTSLNHTHSPTPKLSIPEPITLPTDPTIYPISILLEKALLLSIEPELHEKPSLGFSQFRHATRTSLFLPTILRHTLAQSHLDIPTRLEQARKMAEPYEHLTYFPHTLELLLHTVLEEELDQKPSLPPQRPVTPNTLTPGWTSSYNYAYEEERLLPLVITYLRTYPSFHTTIVHCTRKTDLRAWRYLFESGVGDPKECFRETLERGETSVAGGYLLIVNTLARAEGPEDEGRDSKREEEAMQDMKVLMRKCIQMEDWGTCMELARFLVAIDDSNSSSATSGDALLRDVLKDAGVDLPWLSNGARSPGNGLLSPVGIGMGGWNGVTLGEAPRGRWRREGSEGGTSVGGSSVGGSPSPGRSPGRSDAGEDGVE